jgi:hypothetical protein
MEPLPFRRLLLYCSRLPFDIWAPLWHCCIACLSSNLSVHGQDRLVTDTATQAHACRASVRMLLGRKYRTRRGLGAKGLLCLTRSRAEPMCSWASRNWKARCGIASCQNTNLLLFCSTKKEENRTIRYNVLLSRCRLFSLFAWLISHQQGRSQKSTIGGRVIDLLFTDLVIIVTY